MTVTAKVNVADECWIALALLHRADPSRESFEGSEILKKIREEKIHGEVRAGIQPHVYLHNIANVPPNSARYRLFYRLADGTYRLYRPGDDHHPARTGKSEPRREELPELYRPLLDWYHDEYCRRSAPQEGVEDPVLGMRGIGRELWTSLGGGDAFVARERAGWDEPAD